MVEPLTEDSLRAAAKVMRATAERLEAILEEHPLSEERAVERVGAEVELFVAAMATLEQELGPPA